MKLSSEAVERVCRRVVVRWRSEKAFLPSSHDDEIVKIMRDRVILEFKRRDELNGEAERLLEEYESQAKEEIDRGRMLKMIRDKLAKERGIVL